MISSQWVSVKGGNTQMKNPKNEWKQKVFEVVVALGNIAALVELLLRYL